MEFNLDDINDVMDFVSHILEQGNKVKGKHPVVGYWEWEDYNVMLLNTGDVFLNDQKQLKTITIFSSKRELNNEVMNMRGFVHRQYLIGEFLSWENLEKLEKFEVN